MGAWGTAIFSDDTAMDVRGDYVTELGKGKTNEEATALVIAKHKPETWKDGESVFWIALALTQWKKGRLLDFVREKAVESIDSGADLERWDEPDNQKNYQKRKEVLQKTKEILLSPMPPAKKVPLPAWLRPSPWKKGDVLVYKVMPEKWDNHPDCGPYVNCYFLLRVMKIVTHKNGMEWPIYGVYAWHGNEVPDPSIADGLAFLPLFEDRKFTDDWIDRKYIRKNEGRLLLRDEGYDADRFGDVEKDRLGGGTISGLTIRIARALTKYHEGKTS